jgi:UDP-N-acetylmuramoylalanine--D-glutamate ligase
MLASAAVMADAGPEEMRDAITSFRGLEHRAETVAVLRDIEFIDSSIDTSPTRTLATLSSYGNDTAVIICGKNKGFDYTALAKKLPTATRGAVLMGEVGECLAPLISDPTYPLIRASNMEEAVAYAVDMTGGHGRVILSPAGTSYDKYENYIARGLDFTLATKKYITSKDV